MMGGPYADVEPALQSDGSWHYQYFQEGTDPTKRDSYYTNVGLMVCIADGVPIGVFRQTSVKPDPRYKVMGLAWVREWQPNGYFILDGLSPAEEAFSQSSELTTQAESFNPRSIEDARRWVTSSIVQRQGQGQFRATLLNAYQGRCAITGCDAASALEAAHIIPYNGAETNSARNGILLRADLHTLFDLGLIAIDETTMTLVISSSLSNGHYASLAGGRVQLPVDSKLRPSPQALSAHRALARI
jgi:hypothetical protein